MFNEVGFEEVRFEMRNAEQTYKNLTGK